MENLKGERKPEVAGEVTDMHRHYMRFLKILDYQIHDARIEMRTKEIP